MEIPRRQTFAAATIALDALSDAFHPIALDDQSSDAPVIIVGGGPSGLRAAHEVSRRGFPVVLFNAERWQPYNRVKLTPFLAGEVQIGRVYQADALPPGAKVTQYDGHTIVAINRAEKTVENQFGRRWGYSKLILCVGSRAYIPPIPGRDLSGVFRFRNFDDVEKLVARAMRSRRTVVVGGGLLGLEAARGMSLRKVPTVIVEHEGRLMPRQLDDKGGLLLSTEIEKVGLTVRTGCAVKSIEGDWRVERMRLSSGEVINCDTVIICTGIRSNTELAANAGIAIGRGITVNDAMQTSDPDVYAVGECAEHNGHVYGLVAPGLEQAAVAAAHIAGQTASYRGSVPTTKLKVVGADVFSMGDVDQLDQRTDVRTMTWHDPQHPIYRRLVIQRSRLVGALGVGAWPDVSRVQQAIRDRVIVWPWQAWLFARNGGLYPQTKQQSVRQWPAAATVCNCTGMTRGELGDAIAAGAGSIDMLMRNTGASTICGSCRPLLQELVGGNVVHMPVFGSRTMTGGSLIAAALALIAIFLPAWPYSPSVEAGIGIDRFWTSGTWKQVSGYSFVTLSAIIAFLSIRKRVRLDWLGGYSWWRLMHVVLGAAALAMLFMHTGFNLGHNLNRWLMVTFLTLAIAGSVAGAVTAREHVALAKGKPSYRSVTTWLHILALWPLPLLLTLHVLTVYAY